MDEPWHVTLISVTFSHANGQLTWQGVSEATDAHLLTFRNVTSNRVSY